MPELSRFAGIIIKLLYNDTVQHHKPHVHVYYGNIRRLLPLTENCLPVPCLSDS